MERVCANRSHTRRCMPWPPSFWKSSICIFKMPRPLVPACLPNPQRDCFDRFASNPYMHDRSIEAIEAIDDRRRVVRIRRQERAAGHRPVSRSLTHSYICPHREHSTQGHPMGSSKEEGKASKKKGRKRQRQQQQLNEQAQDGSSLPQPPPPPPPFAVSGLMQQPSGANKQGRLLPIGARLRMERRREKKRRGTVRVIDAWLVLVDWCEA